ncbi:metal-dependent hydrolase [Azospira sp. I09]|jgi:inner membrane protein|uniref:metal-dependent hydrolase n=1 Tax=Azospira sp. I09 TaxID=1765049 RepID=UPI001260F760|nr:metal-dependent hydrolase [Azospira sp. I09]BBN88407.1 membrane protein [Azospira sp. I09]
MPTILTHPAVPLALAWGLSRRHISPRLAAAGALVAILPDLDVLAFRLGIPYAAQFGHRGFSHSLLFALLAALLGTLLARWLHARAAVAFPFLALSGASHGLLDTLTNGGLGIALLWPLAETRFFAPFRPIEVAPLALSRFFSERGLAVLGSELLWVWLPLLSLAALAAFLRRRATRPAP